MIRSGSRAGWAIVIPARTARRLGGRQQHARPARPGADRRLDRRSAWSAGWRAGARSQPGKDELPAVAERMDDARLSSLRSAAESWRKSAAPRRLVVDQVCLVRDLADVSRSDRRVGRTTLLPDSDRRTGMDTALPASVSAGAGGEVRGEGTQRPDRRSTRARPAAPVRGEAAWLKAIEAVRRACSTPPDADGANEGAARRARSRAADAGPGAGRSGQRDDRGRGGAGGGALSTARAPGGFSSATRCSGRVGEHQAIRRRADLWPKPGGLRAGSRRESSAGVAKYDQLGDDCDFLTLAGDWPYRYEVEEAEGPARGVYALDDLIGRTLVGGPSLGGIEQSRRRWAYTGRIIGDPAASVARAMGALFLHPRSALLWNTYSGGTPWSTYTMKSASAQSEPGVARTDRAG